MEYDSVGQLQLRRVYSSNSVFRGHFGPGWCSELDGQVLQYEGGELRYRGCDIVTADLVDARQSAVRVFSNGFWRTREDGATQVFNRAGLLVRVVRGDVGFQIRRDTLGYPLSIEIQNSRGNPRTELKIELESKRVAPYFALIKALGERMRFEFSRGLLISSRDSVKYVYDNQLNMIERTTNEEHESIAYDEVSDRVVGVERSAAFRRERLAVMRNEQSGMIEMKIEVERGAEMHPVRILYHVATRRVSLEGDRGTARILLKWISV